jgi:hypothetical protein
MVNLDNLYDDPDRIDGRYYILSERHLICLECTTPSRVQAISVAKRDDHEIDHLLDQLGGDKRHD